jgi:hypothetical protein
MYYVLPADASWEEYSSGEMLLRPRSSLWPKVKPQIAGFAPDEQKYPGLRPDFLWS